MTRKIFYKDEVVYRIEFVSISHNFCLAFHPRPNFIIMKDRRKATNSNRNKASGVKSNRAVLNKPI